MRSYLNEAVFPGSLPLLFWHTYLLCPLNQLRHEQEPQVLVNSFGLTDDRADQLPFGALHIYELVSFLLPIPPRLRLKLNLVRILGSSMRTNL